VPPSNTFIRAVSISSTDATVLILFHALFLWITQRDVNVNPSDGTLAEPRSPRPQTLKPNECQAEGACVQILYSLAFPHRLLIGRTDNFLGAELACDLQACLGKNTYDPSKCDAQLRKLYECCGSMYDRTNGKGESTACPIPSVVRRWLKSHP
jgi:hypothetical protein